MKKSLLIIAVGLGVGYILGARAGRERYDLIVEKVSGVWEDPRVAKARQEAARYAREQGPIIRDRAGAAAKAAPGIVADRAKATAAAAVKTARSVANTAAAKAGEARDAVLEEDDDF
jgi:hypothetical protein